MRNSILFAVLASLFAAVAAGQDITGIAIDADGNVGIGTQSPIQELHVDGDVYVDGVAYGGGFEGIYGTRALAIAADYVGSTASNFAPLMFRVDATTNPTTIYLYALNPASPTGPALAHKTFVIDHPLATDRYLAHATLEGPEGSVYYRGSGSLTNGRAEIILPDYFEALTRPEGRTVLLTNIDGFDRLAVMTHDGAKISDGHFVVMAENANSNQAFDWEVKAVRADLPVLSVEPLISDVRVRRVGPYAYYEADGAVNTTNTTDKK